VIVSVVNIRNASVFAVLNFRGRHASVILW
jgi:hypothetical protein